MRLDTLRWHKRAKTCAVGSRSYRSRFQVPQPHVPWGGCAVSSLKGRSSFVISARGSADSGRHLDVPLQMPAFLSHQLDRGSLNPFLWSSPDTPTNLRWFCCLFAVGGFLGGAPLLLQLSPVFSRSLDILMANLLEWQGFSGWFKTPRWCHRTGWTWCSWHW